MKNSILRGAACAALVGAIVCASPASALNIVLSPDDSFTQSPNGAAALLGFQKAANYWNKTLSNNVNLLFDVHFAELDEGVLGGTYSNTFGQSAKSVYKQLKATGDSKLDKIAVANLRPLDKGGVDYRTPGIDGGVTSVDVSSRFDNNGTANNTMLNTNTSIDKALKLSVDYSKSGFVGLNKFFSDNGYSDRVNPNADADITFSSTFGFDFDPTNGVDVGTYDFVGVAIHEMGHALGFVSGLDDYDYSIGGMTAAEVDATPVLTTLDLFRYGATTPRPDGTYDLQLDPGRSAFFSVDARNPFVDDEPAIQTSSYFATGANYGDGGQGSHWEDQTRGRVLPNGCFKSDRQEGIMDPTIDDCRKGAITGNDLGAFDAMGWNLNGIDILNDRGYTFDTAQAFKLPGLASIGGVPEPATWAELLLGFGVVGGAARRRARVAGAA